VPANRWAAPSDHPADLNYAIGFTLVAVGAFFIFRGPL
jgi:hypothetical protein